MLASKIMWQRLAKRLVVQEPRGKPFRGSSPDDLQDFERRLCFAFPLSYRAFAVEVGAGLFCGYYRVFTPDFGLEDELATRGLDLFKDIYGDSAFIDRMMPFGSTIGGDVIVWDPDEITASRAREYAIYVLPRDSREKIRLCSDFKTYVSECIFGYAFMKAVNADVAEWTVDYSMERFRPSRRRDRYDPSVKTAKKARANKKSTKKSAKSTRNATKTSGVRRFEFVDGKSHKFWTIELSGKSHSVQFGRIGTDGQEKTKSHETEEKAQASYERLIKEKLAKGYVEKRVKSARPGATTKTHKKKTKKR